MITNSATGEMVILIQDNQGTIRKIRRQNNGNSTTTNKNSGVTKKQSNATNGASGGTAVMEKPETSEYAEDTGGQEADYDFYPVLFRDGVFDVCIVDYSDDTLKEVGRVAIFVLCSMLFIGIIIYYFGREPSP